MKGRLSFEVNLCKGCGLCVDACPLKILALDDSTVNAIGYSPAFIVEPEKCVACLNCAIMCPDSVITIERLDA